MPVDVNENPPCELVDFYENNPRGKIRKDENGEMEELDYQEEHESSFDYSIQPKEEED